MNFWDIFTPRPKRSTYFTVPSSSTANWIRVEISVRRCLRVSFASVQNLPLHYRIFLLSVLTSQYSLWGVSGSIHPEADFSLLRLKLTRRFFTCSHIPSWLFQSNALFASFSFFIIFRSNRTQRSQNGSVSIRGVTRYPLHQRVLATIEEQRCWFAPDYWLYLETPTP